MRSYYIPVALNVVALILAIAALALFVMAESYWREADAVQTLQTPPLRSATAESTPAPDPDHLTDQLGERHYLPGWETAKGGRVNYQGKQFWLTSEGRLWILSDVPPTPAPTMPAVGGPLRKLPDGTWAYRAASGATWADLTQAERDILRLPPLCPKEWYSDPATAGTACPEAIEFVERYDEYKAAFEADYIRRHRQ